MEKTKEGIKKTLRENYAMVCNGYLVELLRMWELDAHYGYWVSDKPGTIYCYGETHNLTMEEIIYIVENDIEEDEVLAWEDYLLDAQEFGFEWPNLRAWHSGCPRTPKETFNHLRDLKANLAKAVEEEKKRIKNEPPRNPILDKKIVDCDLSVRTTNICLKNGVETLGDLVKLHKTDWLKFRNSGRKSLGELDDLLTANGLEWAKYE